MEPSLIGTWRLVSWEFRDAAGGTSSPDAVGYLTYTPDGYMSAMIAARSRAPFASTDVRAATVEEKIDAFDSLYGAYCGTYERRGDTMVHHVEVSLAPNWSGTDIERTIAWDGEHLLLSAAPTPIGGSMQTVQLRWERLRPAYAGRK